MRPKPEEHKLFLGGGNEEKSLEPAARASIIAWVRWLFCSLKTRYKARALSNREPNSIGCITNAFRFFCRSQLKQSLNKFKGGALWLRELF